MLKVGDIFINDAGKKYVVVDISANRVRTEMHSMHEETIYSYRCRKLMNNGKLGKTDRFYSSYNGTPRPVDHIEVRVEYSI